MKKILWVKCFSGLRSAMKGVNTEGWEIETLEDFISTTELTPNEELFAKVHQAIDDPSYDLILFEDPNLYAWALREGVPEHHKIVTPTPEEQRIEIDRMYATSLMKEYGINTLDRVLIGPYNDHTHTEEIEHDLLNTGIVPDANDESFYVVKVNYDGHMVGIGTSHDLATTIIALKMWDKEFTVERYIDTDDWIELSICGAFNGTVFTPFCTLFDPDNRIYTGGYGPKLSDVGQVIVPKVAPMWDDVVDKISRMLRETPYNGWFDLDLMVNPDTKEYIVFETMARFSNPSFAAVMHTDPTYNWLDMIYNANNGLTVTPPEYKNVSICIELGIWSVGMAFNDINSDSEGMIIPTCAHDYEGKSLAFAQVFEDEDGELYVAGDMGRTAVAYATSNNWSYGEIPNWREALMKCYQVADEIEFPGMVVKSNLYGFNDSITADADLDTILGKCISAGIIGGR